MSSGGMDWAYRMMALHDLDPLGGMIVMHLGWRDAANFRTDRGIAMALNQHRSSVRLATAKLAEMGLIVRRSGQWVAAETVAIVEGSPSAPRPDPALSDEGGPVSGPGQSVARGGPVSGPQKGQSVAHTEKENIKKARAVSRVPVRPDRRKSQRGGDDRTALTAFQRDRLLAGQSVIIGGVVVLPGSLDAERLVAAVRSQDAEKRAG